jgi:hypothetical protein
MYDMDNDMVELLEVIEKTKSTSFCKMTLWTLSL